MHAVELLAASARTFAVMAVGSIAVLLVLEVRHVIRKGLETGELDIPATLRILTYLLASGTGVFVLLAYLAR